MSHQELFETQSFNFPLPKRKGLCDINFPRFFSVWPYFILILAAFLMGSAKVSSHELNEFEQPIQMDHKTAF